MPEVSFRNETPIAKIETSVPVAPEVPLTPETTPTDPRIEHLAKKERLLRHRDRQFKEKEAALQAEINALKLKESEYETNYIPKTRLKEQTWDVLQNEGITYDQLTQSVLNQPSPEALELRKMQANLKKIESEQEAIRLEAQKSQDAQYQQALKLIERDVKMIVAADPLAYELIHANQAEEAVVELMKETHEKEGYLMTVEDAAKEVEEYLLEGAFKLAQLKKIQAKLIPKEPEVPANAPAPVKQQGLRVEQSARNPIPPKTLTHQTASPTRPLTSADRRQRAIAVFEGKL